MDPGGFGFRFWETVWIWVGLDPDSGKRYGSGWIWIQILGNGMDPGGFGSRFWEMVWIQVDLDPDFGKRYGSGWIWIPMLGNGMAQ